MQVAATSRAERRLDRRSRDLMAEADPVAALGQHRACEAVVDGRRRLTAHAVEHPQLDRGRSDRHGLQHTPRVRAQPRCAGVNGVADRCRNLVTAGVQHLPHVERVAAGEPVKLPGVDVIAGRELGDGRGRERFDGETRQTGHAGQVAQHDPQRVLSAHRLLAVGDHHQRRHGFDPPPEHAHHVERGLVGPMNVLENDHTG